MPFSSRIASAGAVVGPFAPSQMMRALDVRRVLARDHVLERRRHEHIHVEREQLLVREPVALVEALERLVLLHVRDRLRDVDAVRIVHRARAIADGDDAASFLLQQVAR